MRALRNLTITSACICLVGLSACASHRPTGAQRTTEREALVTVTAIDVPNRLVTVRDASGDPLTVYVDQSNTAFPQADVGDQVRIRYVESLALQLAKSGTPTAVKIKEETSPVRAGRPAGATATEVSTTVRIENVDRNGEFVTFTGPRGLRTVRVRDPEVRNYVRTLKSGDNVEVTYREALALSLEKVAR